MVVSRSVSSTTHRRQKGIQSTRVGLFSANFRITDKMMLKKQPVEKQYRPRRRYDPISIGFTHRPIFILYPLILIPQNLFQVSGHPHFGLSGHRNRGTMAAAMELQTVSPLAYGNFSGTYFMVNSHQPALVHTHRSKENFIRIQQARRISNTIGMSWANKQGLRRLPPASSFYR